MWCDNLPRVQGKLSQVTLPYKDVPEVLNIHVNKSKKTIYSF